MRKPTWIVLLAVQTLAVQIVWVGIRVLAGLLAVDQGAGLAELSVLAAVTAAPALLGALFVGRLCDRVGGGPVSAVGIAILLGGSVIVATAQGFPHLLAGAGVAGAGSLLTILGQQAIVAARSLAGERTGHFSTVTTAASMGQMVGPLLVTGGIPMLNAELGPLLAFGIGCGGLLVAIASLRAGLYPIEGERIPVARSLHSHRLLFLPGVRRSVATSAAVLVTVDLLYTMLPLWAAEREVSATVVGVLLTLRAAVSVVSRLALTRIVSLLGVRTVLLVALTFGVAALVLLAVAPTWTSWAALAMLGISLGVPQPLTMAWVVGLVPRTAQGAVLGLRLLTNRSAQVLLPILVGAPLAPLGFTGFALVNAALLAGAGYLVGKANFPKGALPDWET